MRVLFKHLGELLARPPFAGQVRSVFDSSGSAIDLTLSGTSLDQWITTVVRDTAHAVGTCRMGDPAESITVVDHQCRVLGTENLRIVDASVFPAVPRANTNLTVIMLAEKVADLVTVPAQSGKQARVGLDLTDNAP